MQIRDFKTAAINFFEAVSTFTSTELMNYSNFVKYAVFCLMVALPRSDLKEKVYSSIYTSFILSIYMYLSILPSIYLYVPSPFCTNHLLPIYPSFIYIICPCTCIHSSIYSIPLLCLFTYSFIYLTR